MIKQRQRIIRLADESELGWKVVDEYMQSEIASDEEDQKKITGHKLGHELRQSLSMKHEASVTCHTDKGRQRQLLIRHISRGHNNSISKNLAFVICVVKSGIGRPTVRQTREILS